MKEAIGNSFVLNFIITFLILFMLVFVGTLAYTKAFKVKNRIVDIIENHDGNIVGAEGKLDNDFQTEVDTTLGKMGYRISSKTECEIRNTNAVKLEKVNDSNYRYCIFQNTTERGNYYSVVAYIYFEVPLIGTKLEFPVYGETRVFMNL